MSSSSEKYNPRRQIDWRRQDKNNNAKRLQNMSSSENNGTHVSISAVPECDAVAASETKDNFGVLVRLRAPPLSEDAIRAPIDLVMVLDVSGSMSGPKLDLVKRAASFVIDHLGPSDQLSVVSFQNIAMRNLPLCRMTELGRADAKRAVHSLFTCGGTNIVQGLTMGVQVLEERLHRNPVASILFLSDGQDTYNHLGMKHPSQYLPSSIARGTDDRHQAIPIHSFGFGSDHDPLVMNAIADFSGGVFSFIESYESVQQAFASCIGGLLSVVVRELSLTLRASSQGVDIKSIPSGKHVSEISYQGSRGNVFVGDLYADEEKEFLVNISVPVYVNDDESNGRRTPLLVIMCSYVDELSNAKVHMEYAEIKRPDVPLPCDVKVKLEVDRHRNRLNVVEGLADAQRLAETGNLKGACDILSMRISSLQASAAGQAGDDLSLQLEAEMRETKDKMGCQRSYDMAGCAYALSSISAHGNQRAMAFASAGAYVTPSMANMVNKSRQLEPEKDNMGFKRPAPYALSSISEHDNQWTTASGSAGAYVTPNMANMVDKSRKHIKSENVKMEER